MDKLTRYILTEKCDLMQVQKGIFDSFLQQLLNDNSRTNANIDRFLVYSSDCQHLFLEFQTDWTKEEKQELKSFIIKKLQSDIDVYRGINTANIFEGARRELIFDRQLQHEPEH